MPGEHARPNTIEIRETPVSKSVFPARFALQIINEHLETQVIDPILGRTRRWSPTVRYLSQTEVHVYALSSPPAFC